jgi:ADP-ribose pyrophosphatase
MADGKVLRSEVIVAKPKRFVREDLLMDDGFEIDWYYMDTPPSVMVVAVTEDGNLVMVRQYRHNLKRDTWELPAGAVSDGETPEAAAGRELEEETGYRLAEGAHLRGLGAFYSLPSETNKVTHVYLASPVVRFGAAAGDSEIERYFDMAVTEVPVAQVLQRLGEDINGMETMGALLRARELLDGAL